MSVIWTKSPLYVVAVSGNYEQWMTDRVLERNFSCLKRNEKGPLFHPNLDSFPLKSKVPHTETKHRNCEPNWWKVFCYILVLVFSCYTVFILESETKLIPNIHSWRQMLLEHANLLPLKATPEVPNMVALKLAFRWRPCIHCCSLQQGAPLDPVLWPGVAFSNFQGLETQRTFAYQIPFLTV